MVCVSWNRIYELVQIEMCLRLPNIYHHHHFLNTHTLSFSFKCHENFVTWRDKSGENHRDGNKAQFLSCIFFRKKLFSVYYRLFHGEQWQSQMLTKHVQKLGVCDRGLSECQEVSILIPMTRISCIKAGTDTHYGGLELLLFVGGQCSIQRPSNIRLTAA